MGRISKAEAAARMRDLVDEIYGALEEMYRLLKEVAPEKLDAAERYWMAHIDGALYNKQGWLGSSMLKAQDTIEELEREAEEEE